MSGDQIFWVSVTAIVAPAVVAAIPLAGVFGRLIARDVWAAKLKVEMVRQGYAADDIERVVRATEAGGRDARLPAAAPADA